MKWQDALTRDGFVTVPGVFTPPEVDAIVAALDRALNGETGSEIRNPAGTLTAARNVLALWPGVADLALRPSLHTLLAETLGPRFGLVRVLFFDKPPEQTWALPWHKDLTVAVREHRPAGTRFGKPTFKAGVPHAEAPLELLETMLTVRIHLDAVTDENGPMKVIPGSHRTGKAMAFDDTPSVNILARRGDALLIRPLVAHASSRSRPGTALHRRVLHLEFAGTLELSDGYQWHTFVPLGSPNPAATRCDPPAACA
jgi:hypothetical protein